VRRADRRPTARRLADVPRSVAAITLQWQEASRLHSI